jgi:hypothetical protein
MHVPLPPGETHSGLCPPTQCGLFSASLATATRPGYLPLRAPGGFTLMTAARRALESSRSIAEICTGSSPVPVETEQPAAVCRRPTGLEAPKRGSNRALAMFRPLPLPQMTYRESRTDGTGLTLSLPALPLHSLAARPMGEPGT